MPLTLPNFVTLWPKCARYSLQIILLPGKVGQSSLNSGNKCPFARHVTMPFFCATTRCVRNIRCRKFMLPKKWTKVHQNSLRSAMHQCPWLRQISSRSAKRCTRKALQFFHILQYFGAPTGSLGQSSLISALMYSKAPSINLPNFVPLWQPIYALSLPSAIWARDTRSSTDGRHWQMTIDKYSLSFIRYFFTAVGPSRWSTLSVVKNDDPQCRPTLSAIKVARQPSKNIE